MKLSYRNGGLVLISIVLLGFILRLYGLGSGSIRGDEGYSIYFASKDMSSLTSLLVYTVHPPLYYTVLRFWMELGDSEFILRFLSLIFGVLSIFLTFHLGKYLFNKNVGLLSALIMAISQFHILHTQMCRNHDLFLFLVLISFYFFVRFLTTIDAIFKKFAVAILLSIQKKFNWFNNF